MMMMIIIIIITVARVRVLVADIDELLKRFHIQAYLPF
jgi:hypothetical protein